MFDFIRAVVDTLFLEQCYLSSRLGHSFVSDV